MPEEQEQDEQFFDQLGPLPTAKRTNLPVVTEQEAREIREEEERRKEAEESQHRKEAEEERSREMEEERRRKEAEQHRRRPTEIIIEAETLEEVEVILQNREIELLSYGITKDTIDKEFALARAAWEKEMQKRQQQPQEDEGRPSQTQPEAATTSRRLVKTCGKRKEGRFRDQLEQEERAQKKKKFRSEQPPWENQRPPPPPPITKKKKKWRPGTVALREIRKYQKSTDLLIPKAPFSRLVRETMEKYTDRVDRIQSTALEALQEAAEDIVVSVFEDSVRCMAHAKRVTLKPVDMALALRLRLENSLLPQ